MSQDKAKRLETQLRTILGDQYIDGRKFDFPDLIDDAHSIVTVLLAIHFEDAAYLEQFGFKSGDVYKLIRLKVTSEELDDWDVLDEEEKKETAKLCGFAYDVKEHDTKIIEKAFHGKFEGEQGMSDKIRDRLDQYMTECASEWEKGNSLGVNGPICLISQSSGYGKSRMLYEVALNRIMTYICLRRDGDYGYPKRTLLATYFNSTYFSDEYAAKSIVYGLIQNALNDVRNILARLGKSALADPETTRQVAAAYRGKQPWKINTNQTSDQISKRAYSSDEIRKLQQEFKATMRNQPLLIVIDEAQELFINSQSIMLSYLQAVIYKHFFRFPIAIVLVSKNCSITHYHRAPQQCALTVKDAKADPYRPFNSMILTDSSSQLNEYTNQLIEIYDSLWCSRSNQDVSKAKQIKVDLYKWLKKLCPQSSFFLFGRPLWTAYYNTDRNNMMRISREKLLHPSSCIKGHLIREAFSLFVSNTLSVLGSRTDFFIHRINPSYVTACELIDKCMATLIDVDNKIGQITLRYVSEPILANAAAYYMCQMPYLHDMLECFLQYLERTSNKLSLGELGELAAELILLIAKDQAAVRKYPDDQFKHARPITLDDFLTSLLGKNYTKKMRVDIPTHLREGLVSFSHFTKKVDELTTKDLFCDFIGRNAAGLFMDSFPGHDLFIPLVLKQEPWLGLVLIKAENRINFFASDQLNRIHQKADPCKIGKALEYPFNETNCVCLIMDLVNPSSKLNIEVDDKSLEQNEQSADINKPTVEKLSDADYKHVSYLIRGCNSNVYPCLDETVSKKITQLINMPRNPLKNYSWIAQKAGFNGARSKESLEIVSIDGKSDPEELTAKHSR